MKTADLVTKNAPKSRKRTSPRTGAAFDLRSLYELLHEYRFRAECMHDVWEFLKKAADHARAGESTWVARYEIHGDNLLGAGACDVAFWSDDEDGSGFRRVLQEIPDGHVMVETLALAKHYTGERTTSEAAQILRLRKEALTPREFLRAARAVKNPTLFLCRHRKLLESWSWADVTVPILHQLDAKELFPTPALRAIVEALEEVVGMTRPRVVA